MMSLCDVVKDYPNFIQGVKFYRTVALNTTITFSLLTFMTSNLIIKF